MMKKIPLTQGKFAIVDAEDFEWLSQHKWSTAKRGNMFYAATTVRVNGRAYYILMHRLILGLGSDQLTDHKDRNGLNNRKTNLRVATNSQNQRNSPSRAGTSKFRGVRWHKDRKRWQTTIQKNRKKMHLGYFESEKEAALKYDEIAKKIFGEFAFLNFPHLGPA